MKWPFVTRRWAERELAEMAKHLCDHQWKITGVSFNPPRSGGWEAKGFIGQQYIDELLHGMSTVTKRCERCGDVTTTRHVGRVTMPGFVWKD